MLDNANEPAGLDAPPDPELDDWPDDEELRGGPPWLPHDQPERPFDTWTWLCDCEACILALQAEAARRPWLALCLKTNADRLLVSAEYLASVMRAGRPAEDVCYVPDDWVREIFVARDYYRLRITRERWWSRTRYEDEELLGIRHLRRRKAMRQPASARAERRRVWENRAKPMRSPE